MAYPKSMAQSAGQVGAYLETSVDIASIAAATTLDVQLAAPRNFRYDRPVTVQLKSGQAVLNAGVSIVGVGRVVNNAGKKIEFRVINATAGALDPATKVFQFIQV